MENHSTIASAIQQTPLVNTKPSKRDYAITLAESGFEIFPLEPNGKIPAHAGVNWRKIASSDPQRVAEMWTDPVMESELDYNIGIALDAETVVVDVDTRDGKKGDKSLQLLEAIYGRVPPSFTVKSAGGGTHLYFKTETPVGNSASKVGEHIDIKSEGGFVVGPGSTIDGVAYEVIDYSPITALPVWIIQLAGAPRPRNTEGSAPPLVDLDSVDAVRRATDYLTSKAPDNGTYSVAAKVKDFGVSEETCFDLMLEHWRDARGLPKDDDHIRFRVENAYRYGQNAPGIASAEAEFDAVEIDSVKPTTDWQPPADLWEDDRAPDELPADSVPPYVAKFAEDRALRLGVDSGAMAAATITALSSLVPAGNNLQMRQHSNSWSVKCVVWTAIIDDPGTAKSPAVNAALTFPRATDHVWRTNYAKERDRFELSRPQPNAERRKQLPQKAKEAEDTPTTIETSDELFPDDNIENAPAAEPVLRRKIVNDATTEALSTVLATCPDVAPILLHSDELAGIIGGMDAYRSRGAKDRPFFLSAKEGASFTIDRKSSGATIVPALAISILGTIQDDKLSKIAPTLTDDGFLQRFAPIMIKRTGRGIDVPDDPAIDGSVARVALALTDLEAKDYRLAPEAAGELDAINDFVESECNRVELSPALKTWVNKTPNEFGRYCLAFHLIEWATGMNPALGLPPEPLVSQATAIRARRYVQEFIFSHARHVYGTVMARGLDDADVRWVAGYILTRNLSTITARDIGRAYRSLRGSNNRAKLRTVMAALGAHDWVKVTNTVRGEWAVNPAVRDGRFRAIAKSETARRAAVRAEITITAAERRTSKKDRPS